jgi:mannose-6-phosphate isomerase-like protein (cupin superfamily)
MSATFSLTRRGLLAGSAALGAGEVLFVPAGTIHAAKNVGSGNAAELATYIAKKGKPLVVLGQASAR